MLNVAVIKYTNYLGKTKIEEAIEVNPRFTATPLKHARIGFIEDGDKEYLIYNNKVLNTEEIDAAFYAREYTPHIGATLRFFSNSGIYCPQPYKAASIAENKYLSYQLFREHNVNIPKTILLYKNTNIESLQSTLGDYPYVIKPLYGLRGYGIKLINTFEELNEYLANSQYQSFVLQECISPNKRQDERHIVVGDRVVSSMLRTAKEGNFLTHLHYGAKAQPIKCDGETEDLCIRAAKAVGLDYGGIDVIRDEYGSPYVLEINSNPASTIIEVTNHNHFNELLEFLEEKVC